MLLLIQSKMEVNSGVVVFLVLLSTLLFGCVTFSSLHNAHQIAELQLKLQQLEDQPQGSSNTDNEVLLTKLMSGITNMISNEDLNTKSTDQQSSHRLRRSVTNQEPNTTDSETEQVPDSPPGGSLQLLANALFDIVERQLDSKLDCTELKGETECSILPGPKGEQGVRGSRGPVGEKGDEGDLGKQGEKGEPGYPGYKGEKGQMGHLGPQGPVGPQGITGPAGPVATLRQNGCSWYYTDHCGHSCGTGTRKLVTCPVGQYVAGFGIYTWNANGRYNTHIWCCTV